MHLVGIALLAFHSATVVAVLANDTVMLALQFGDTVYTAEFSKSDLKPNRGDLIKVLWFDGDGLCLFAKRLERGRFVWPQATSGTVSLTRAQLSMLLEAIDWRRPMTTELNFKLGHFPGARQVNRRRGSPSAEFME